MFQMIGDNLAEIIGYLCFGGIFGVWPCIACLMKGAFREALEEVNGAEEIRKKSGPGKAAVFSLVYLTGYTLLMVVYLVHILLYKV